MTEFDPASVARAPAKGLSAVGFRNQASEFNNPLSGEGARLFGGHFNPPLSFAVIYLCTTHACAAELTPKIGKAAYQARFHAVLSPSATVVNQVLAVFSENLVGAVLTTATVGEWNEPNNLPTSTQLVHYPSHRHAEFIFSGLEHSLQISPLGFNENK